MKNLKVQKTRELLERLQILTEERAHLDCRITNLTDEMNEVKYEIQQRTKEDANA